jgi:hypothetical protein
MDQSLPFSRSDSTSRALRRPSIWSELLQAMPMVLFIVAIREAWAWHRAQEDAPRGG